eukprot:1787078-Rhodomonas_salina.2
MVSWRTRERDGQEKSSEGIKRTRLPLPHQAGCIGNNTKKERRQKTHGKVFLPPGRRPPAPKHRRENLKLNGFASCKTC